MYYRLANIKIFYQFYRIIFDKSKNRSTNEFKKVSTVSFRQI